MNKPLFRSRTIRNICVLSGLLVGTTEVNAPAYAAGRPAQASAPGARQSGGVKLSSDAKAIIALELELTGLLERGAFDDYATHLASGYFLTTPQGQVVTRSEALASWRARGPGDKMVPDEMRVRVYGDTAILSARVVDADAGPGGDRITKTFVRVKGKWLLAALHISQIVKPQK